MTEKRLTVHEFVVQTGPKSSLKATESKAGFSSVKILLDAEPDKNMPEYGEILLKSFMKGFQVPCRVTSKGHQNVEGQEGAIKVPFSQPSRM